MVVIEDATRRTGDLPQGGIGTIGKYDGIHRGQRTILDRVVERARQQGLAPVVITFEPHPLTILAPDRVPAPLTTPEQKQRLLEETGVEVLLVVRFDRQLADTPPEVFVREFIYGALRLEAVYVGQDFCFGRHREGDLELLARLGTELGFEAHGVPEVLFRGERISSSRIRQALVEGRSEDAMAMLGRPYAVTGKVVRGDRMGQRLGWPTINVATDNEVLPADGVYAGRVVFPSLSTPFEAVTNIGTRPTVYENHQRVMESHVLDFSGDVYGERVEVQLMKRLREERIFPTVMDLSAQIGRDVESTREYFAARRREAEGIYVTTSGTDDDEG